MKALIVALSIGAATLGVIVPSTANRLGHALVAVLALAGLVAAIQPAITKWEITRAAAFADGDFVRSPSVAPSVIVEMADDIATSRRTLSARTTARLRTIAVARLVDDQPVSPTLQAIVDGAVGPTGIARSELDDILTELESL